MSTQKPLLQMSVMMLFCQQYTIIRWRVYLNIENFFKAITLTLSSGHVEPLDFILWITLLISQYVGGDKSNGEFCSSKIFIHDGAE